MTDPTPAEILRRLESLERRLTWLENVIDPVSDRPAPPPAIQLTPAQPDRTTLAPLPAAPTPPVSPVVAAMPNAARAPRPIMSPPTPPRKLTPPTHAKPKPPRQPVSMEQLIGGKWFLVLGVVIVVAGAGFFLKLAYDQGWIQQIPPAVRCIISAAFGFLLMGVGELTARKLGRFAAVGFRAAGLGVLYATAFATYAVFGLVGPAVAFLLLVGVCALGLASALRARSLALSILSIGAAYGVPLILARDDSPVWTLPTYLLALLTVGSILAIRVPRHRVLASIVWWGTGLLGSAWLFDQSHINPPLAAAFVALTWLGVHATRVHLPGWRRVNPGMPGVTSFSTTVWAVGGMLLVFDDWGLADWQVPAGFFVVTALSGMVLAGFLRALTDKPRNEREVIGVSLIAQAGALLPMAIFMAVDTAWSQILTWFALGLACVFAARWARATALFWYAAAMLALGSSATFFQADGPLHAGEPSVIGLVFTPWMGLMLAFAAAWTTLALVIHRTPDAVPTAAAPVLRRIAMVAGAIFVSVFFLHESASETAIMATYMAMAALALLAEGQTRPWPAALAAIYTPIAALLWLNIHFDPGWFSPEHTHIGPFHAGLLWSIPIALLFARLGRVAQRHAPEDLNSLRYLPIGLAAGLLLTTSTLEVARHAGNLITDSTARAGSVSLWWAVVGVSALVLGFVRRRPAPRYFGLGLLLAAAAKVLTYDLAAVNPAVRVACFIALGLILLGVAAWYLRAAKPQSDTASDAPDRGEDTPFPRP